MRAFQRKVVTAARFCPRAGVLGAAAVSASAVSPIVCVTRMARGLTSTAPWRGKCWLEVGGDGG